MIKEFMTLLAEPTAIFGAGTGDPRPAAIFGGAPLLAGIRAPAFGGGDFGGGVLAPAPLAAAGARRCAPLTGGKAATLLDALEQPLHNGFSSRVA